MRELSVSIEINGIQKHIGSIRGDSSSDARFFYSDDYLNQEEAKPISLSLPLQREVFSARTTKAFFEGLLPEGFTRRSVAQWLHADSEDYLTILSGLGCECLGAIQVTDSGHSPQTPSYELLTPEQIKNFAQEGVANSAQLVTKAHLSLTGASGKTGLYFDEDHNKWYLPMGTAPSTHIVKQSHVRLRDIVPNEQLCLQTAANLGIDVPESFILQADGTEDTSALFATRRYDRTMHDSCMSISGLKCPCRLHQEDFAQALGISASEKYEKPGEGYLRKMFALIRSYASDPLRDQLRLWDRIIFDFLVGNTDCHIKNFSLLYSPDLSTLSLAPAYDIISTAVYENSTRDMAFCIADRQNLSEIDRNAFAQAAPEAGIGKKAALDRFDRLAEQFNPALAAAADKLAKQGFTSVYGIKEQILQLGGIANVL